ncbi:MAG TPA: HAMP domain-containing sensor histidine kinase [Streptosporangiaceae bacterium]
MAISAARNAARARLRLPRGTARLRLTALYGGLFLACGAVLLAVSYVLAEQAIAPGGKVNQTAFTQIQIPAGLITVHRGFQTLSTGQLFDLELTLGKEITTSDLRQVLIDAPIALAIVTVVALALGWLVAGRVLRPLAVITAAARRISASSLDQRLALRGPDDELKALGDTLDDLLARLQASFDAQRHFVANASHELRTPITRERAMLQVALDDAGTTAQTWRSVARAVLASNAEQESLIEALLTLATSEGGLGQQEPVDLAAVTDEVLLAARPEAVRHGLSLQAVTGPAPLLGDKLLAGRLVANLVDNAVRHNVAGGHVEVTTGTRDGRAVLSVASTGPVIPAAEVGRLFQPFQRLDENRAHQGDGHGLGLSIVQAIAADHGAAITARARRGGGLSIEVTFPAMPDEPLYASAGVANRGGEGGSAGVRSAR